MSLPTSFRALVSNGKKLAVVRTLLFVNNLKPDEILVRIRSAALNPADIMALDSDATVEGTRLGSDGSGDVVEIGSEVQQFKVGDRVAGFVTGDPTNGTYAEYARFNPAVTVKIPNSFSYNEGAALSVAQGCAIQGLYSRLNVPRPSKPGNKQDIIVVWGGSTATGHYVVQLATLSGLRVFVTASPAAHEYLKELGAEQTFDYRDEDVVAKIKKAAGDTEIKYGFDTKAQGGSGSKIVDTIGPNGGYVITLLPQPDAEGRRPDVKVEFMGLPEVLSSDSPDQAAYRDYLDNEFPSLVDGWVEGKGSSKLKPQKLRVLEGGLDRIPEGLDIMRNGAYGREKLVYPIA